MKMLLPPGWPRPKGYANGVAARGRMIFVAGQIGWNADGKFPSDTLAGQVRSAFRTEMHALRVNGESHIANVSDPQIPAALLPVVKGIVSLHDFRPRTYVRRYAEFQVVSLEALVRMKLLAWRNLDRTHLGDMIGVGLLAATWPARYPAPLGARLQQLLDDPNG